MKRKLVQACLLFLALSCGCPLAGQEPASFTSSRTDAQAPGFRARLLLVKADWSQSPAAEEIGSSLRRLLQNELVPQELRDKLPASATQILFPPGIAAHYTAEHFEQLLAWLKAKELVVEEKLFPRPGGIEVSSDERRRTETPDGFLVPEPSHGRLVTFLAKPYQFLDLPPIPDRGSSQPFIRREAQLLWHVSQDDRRVPAGPIYVEQQLRISERSRDQADNDKPLRRLVLERTGVQFKIDDGYVEIINAFQSPNQSTFLAAARRKGVEALIAVFSGNLQLPGAPEPLLHLPDKVRPISVFQQETWQDFPAQSGAPAPGTTASPGATAAPGGIAEADRAAADDSQLKVLTLTSARAGDMAAVVSQMFGEVRVSVDERTNSVILAGPPASLEMIRALLTRLDAPVQAQSPGGAAAQTRQLMGGSVAELGRQYAASEERAAEIARQIRQLPAGSSDREKLTAELRRTVAESFAARQKLHQAELAALEQRLTGIRQTIATRERIQDQIMDRRVADLVNPALQWDADSRSRPLGGTIAESSAAQVPSGGRDLQAARAYRDKLRERWEALQPIYTAGRARFEDVLLAAKELGEAEDAAAASPGERRSAREANVNRIKQIKSIVDRKAEEGVEPVQNKLAVDAELLKAEAQLAAEETSSRQPASSSPAPNVPAYLPPTAAPGQSLILRSAEEFDRAHREAETSVNAAEAFVRRSPTGKSPPLVAQSRLRDAQRRLELVQQEYAAQIRLLELELKDAESALEAASENRRAMRTVYEGGAIPQSKMIEAERSFEAGALRRERAQTLLELYRRAAPEKPPEPMPADPARD